MTVELSRYLRSETHDGEKEHYHLNNSKGNQYMIYCDIIKSLKTPEYKIKLGKDGNNEIFLHTRTYDIEPILRLHVYNPDDKGPIRKDRWRIKFEFTDDWRKKYPLIVDDVVTKIDRVIESYQEIPKVPISEDELEKKLRKLREGRKICLDKKIEKKKKPERTFLPPPTGFIEMYGYLYPAKTPSYVYSLLTPNKKQRK
jgi:hypothetical protein